MHSNGQNYLESDKTRGNLNIFYKDIQNIQTTIFIVSKII